MFQIVLFLTQISMYAKRRVSRSNIVIP